MPQENGRGTRSTNHFEQDEGRMKLCPKHRVQREALETRRMPQRMSL